MEKTLIIFKPSAIQREIVGEILSRFEKKGLQIVGIKMMQLSDEKLADHYAHLVSKPFYRSIKDSMQKSPVIVMCLQGLECVEVVRKMVGETNGRKSAPGTIRGDFSVSNQENIIHASDSVENAQKEIARFFSEEELFEYRKSSFDYLYASDEV